jgi:hypothetical protein
LKRWDDDLKAGASADELATSPANGLPVLDSHVSLKARCREHEKVPAGRELRVPSFIAGVACTVAELGRVERAIPPVRAQSDRLGAYGVSRDARRGPYQLVSG